MLTCLISVLPSSASSQSYSQSSESARYSADMSFLSPMPGPFSSSRSGSGSGNGSHSRRGSLPGMDLDLDLPPSSSSGSRPSYIAFTSRASMHFPSSLPILPPLSLEQDQDRAPDSPLHLSSPSDGTGTPMGSHASRGLRRFAKRATFSQAQLAIMEEMWNQGEYPSVEQVDQCAKETGLTTKQVRTW